MALSLSGTMLAACKVILLQYFPQVRAFSPRQCLILSLLTLLIYWLAFFLKGWLRAHARAQRIVCFLLLAYGGFFAHAFAHAAALCLPFSGAYWLGLALCLGLSLGLYPHLHAGGALYALLLAVLMPLLPAQAASDQCAAWPYGLIFLSGLFPLLGVKTAALSPAQQQRVCACASAFTGGYCLLEALLLPAPLLRALCQTGKNGFYVSALTLSVCALHTLISLLRAANSANFTITKAM